MIEPSKQSENLPTNHNGPKVSSIGTILTGLVGLTQATLHIHRADAPVIQQRLAICTTCPHATRIPGKSELAATSRCLVCTCFIHPKTTLTPEKCPLGKW